MINSEVDVLLIGSSVPSLYCARRAKSYNGDLDILVLDLDHYDRSEEIVGAPFVKHLGTQIPDECIKSQITSVEVTSDSKRVTLTPEDVDNRFICYEGSFGWVVDLYTWRESLLPSSGDRPYTIRVSDNISSISNSRNGVEVVVDDETIEAEDVVIADDPSYTYSKLSGFNSEDLEPTESSVEYKPTYGLTRSKLKVDLLGHSTDNKLKESDGVTKPLRACKLDSVTLISEPGHHLDPLGIADFIYKMRSAKLMSRALHSLDNSDFDDSWKSSYMSELQNRAMLKEMLSNQEAGGYNNVVTFLEELDFSAIKDVDTVPMSIWSVRKADSDAEFASPS